MTYSLKFLSVARKEWDKLSEPAKSQFKKKLAEPLKHPKVPADRLHGYTTVYKIKLRSLGYRLVYEVIDDTLVVLVIAVGKQEKNQIYRQVDQRKG